MSKMSLDHVYSLFFGCYFMVFLSTGIWGNLIYYLGKLSNYSYSHVHTRAVTRAVTRVTSSEYTPLQWQGLSTSTTRARCASLYVTLDLTVYVIPYVTKLREVTINTSVIRTATYCSASTFLLVGFSPDYFKVCSSLQQK